MKSDNKSYKKGQVAVEYMITYGWALLILVIALGALLFYLQGMNNTYKEQCIFPPQIICSNFAAVDSGEMDIIKMNLTNNFEYAIQINSIIYKPRNYPNITYNGISFKFKTGESKILPTPSTNKLNLRKGDRFIGDVIIKYSVCPVNINNCYGDYSIRGHIVAKVLSSN